MEYNQPLYRLQQQRDSLKGTLEYIQKLLADNNISDRLRESLKAEQVTIQDLAKQLSVLIETRVREKHDTCKHESVTEIIDNDRVIFECDNCGAVFSELPNGADISKKKEVY